MSNSKELIDYLKNSPVFASSLGSKELFHSNIWAYLIEQDSRFLEVFFPKKYDSVTQEIIKDKETGEKARREKYNMDLLIVTNKKVFVIENKIKALPHKDQLQKYQKKLDEHFQTEERCLLLTGIKKDKPSIIDESEWDYLNYDKIAAGIREKLKGCEDKNYYVFANEYCDMIVKLSALLNSSIEEIRSKYYFPKFRDKYEDNALLKGIEQLRIGDIFQKLNADCFVQHVQEIIGGRFSEKPKCNSGYTHQHSLAEFYFERERKSEKEEDITQHARIGVQIQETQFRWFICTRTIKSLDAVEVFDFGKDKTLGWFFERGNGELNQCPTGCERKSSMRKSKDYCQFKTSTDTFVYQYIDIKDNQCDFKTLTDMVNEFLKIADGKIDSISSYFLG